MRELYHKGLMNRNSEFSGFFDTPPTYTPSIPPNFTPIGVAHATAPLV